MNEKGFSPAQIVISGAIGIGLAVLVVWYLDYERGVEISETDRQIGEIISKTSKEEGIRTDDFKIITQNENFARAEIYDSLMKEKYNVFVAKVNGEWVVFDILRTNQSISCERFEKAGFPNSFVSDCKLQYPNAVTAKSFVEKLSENENSISDELSQIIGIFSESSDPNCNCFDVTSGGGTVTVTYSGSGDNPELTNGDTVVVTVEGTTEGQIDAAVVEEIGDGNSGGNNNGNSSGSSSGGNGEEDPSDSDFSFTDSPPEAADPEWLLLNLLDIDNSVIDVQLLND